MKLKKLSTPVNFILFQINWFACVVGAAENMGWLGPVLVGITVPMQICLLTEKYRAETVFVLVCGFFGFILETLLILNNVYAPVGMQSFSVSPPWMIALWFNFALLVSLSLSWLKGKYILAAVVGGLAGPVAYWGGEKIGALVIGGELTRGYVPLALVWTLALPFLVFLHSRLVRS